MRKRITEIFPFLIPLRIWQRNLFYFWQMRFDGNKYAKNFSEQKLKYEVCHVRSLLINKESGYDIKYQYNKVTNLKITSEGMNKLIIYPGEVFSFCYLKKKFCQHKKYKKGLVLINGKITQTKGGGICGLSNALYEAFLLSPLKIIERHPHKVKSLPNASKNDLDGIDATISSGWLDLKVLNNTSDIYQLIIDFTNDYMDIYLLTNKEYNYETKLKNENVKYFQEDNKNYEQVDVIKEVKNKTTGDVTKEKLYTEKILITYKMKEDELICKN